MSSVESKNYLQILQYDDEYFARNFHQLCRLYLWSENNTRNFNLDDINHLRIYRNEAFGFSGCVVDETVKSLRTFLQDNMGLNFHGTELYAHSSLLCGRYLLAT